MLYVSLLFPGRNLKTFRRFLDPHFSPTNLISQRRIRLLDFLTSSLGLLCLNETIVNPRVYLQISKYGIQIQRLHFFFASLIHWLVYANVIIHLSVGEKPTIFTLPHSRLGKYPGLFTSTSPSVNNCSQGTNTLRGITVLVYTQQVNISKIIYFHLNKIKKKTAAILSCFPLDC